MAEQCSRRCAGRTQHHRTQRASDAGAVRRRRPAQGRGRRHLRHGRQDVRQAALRRSGDHGPRERRHHRGRGGEVQAAARRGRRRPRLRRALRRLLQLRMVPHRRVPALRGHRLADQPRRPPLRLHLVGEPRHPVGRFLPVHVPAVECGPAQGAGRRDRRTRRPRHTAVERHRVGAARGGRRLRRHGAHRGPGPAGAVAGRRLQAGRRVEDHRQRHDAG